ncbi:MULTISPECIES: hypothetical protein [unclassified Brevundimonas]|uniref:hypothetical protein n=1 Tax=unclassified Brevundimonas TaxID=2622653 RepID=UPI0025C1A92C|nr:MULTISPECIES: hypothetical protein [unclassified Brevundimonas]
MNRRFLSPLAPIESREDAKALLRGSVIAFGLWACVLLAHAGGIMAGFGDVAAEERGGTTALAFWLAVLAMTLAFVQLRKPNRILPLAGITWSLFELSSILVSLLVGAPLALGGFPAWTGVITAVALGLCGWLHIGGLRGAARISSFA